ncbi:MAG: putative pyrophosphohydrolase [Candidatus Saccharibacteria bacterium]|nr:putative pyrophosphohydrolase [Candidatus Saccharibacteria bacterium]
MSEYDPNYVEVKYFYRIGVKVVVINGNNEVLILRRSDKTPRAGGWDLPGGAVDENEAPQVAAIRETAEESGIVIPSAKIIVSDYIPHTDPWVILGFSAYVDNPEVILSWEHDEYRWIPIGDIESTELPEGYKLLVRVAQSASQQSAS